MSEEKERPIIKHAKEVIDKWLRVNDDGSHFPTSVRVILENLEKGCCGRLREALERMPHRWDCKINTDYYKELKENNKQLGQKDCTCGRTKALASSSEPCSCCGMREALEFYANEKNYDENGAPGINRKSFDGEVTEYIFEADNGYIAEQALKNSGACEQEKRKYKSVSDQRIRFANKIEALESKAERYRVALEEISKLPAKADPYDMASNAECDMLEIALAALKAEGQ